MPEEKEQIGKITHFFSKISVAVLELTAPLKVGEKILIKGGETEFEQEVDSMQVDHKELEEAKAGDSVGLKTAESVRPGYLVFRA